MNQEQFIAIMPYICADLVAMISNKEFRSMMQYISFIPLSSTPCLKKSKQRYGNTVRICSIPCFGKKKKQEA